MKHKAVTIDGPAGSGKSTIARQVADRLGFVYLDTGALYRAAALAVEAGEPPQVLRQRVTSPGGTTAAALDAFAAGGFADLVDRAVSAATERGRALAKGG